MVGIISDLTVTLQIEQVRSISLARLLAIILFHGRVADPCKDSTVGIRRAGAADFLLIERTYLTPLSSG